MRELITCHYCGKELYALGEITKDHIVPRALGGLDIRWNIVLSCRDCNSRKADVWPTCKCNRCSKTRRRHWEMLGINEFKNKRTVKK